MKRSLKKALNLPRAPLPRQTGGYMKVRTKVIFRNRKHKGNDNNDE